MDRGDLGLENVPLRKGAIAGVAAWVVGLATTAGVFLAFGGFVADEFGPAGQTVLVYTQFHLWPVLVQSLSPVLVFWLLPMAILTGAGYWVARETGVNGWIPVGVAVTAGYYPASALSFAAFVDPVAIVSVLVLLTAVAMPLVFAGLGGTFVRDAEQPADARPGE
jgi:hypothetical protein